MDMAQSLARTAYLNQTSHKTLHKTYLPPKPTCLELQVKSSKKCYKYWTVVISKQKNIELLSDYFKISLAFLKKI